MDFPAAQFEELVAVPRHGPSFALKVMSLNRRVVQIRTYGHLMRNMAQAGQWPEDRRQPRVTIVGYTESSSAKSKTCTTTLKKFHHCH